MNLNQPLVIRVFFNTEQEAESAHSQLEDMGVFCDMVKSDTEEMFPFKVLFSDTSLNLAKVSLRRMQIKPAMSQVFDSNGETAEGWPSFKNFSIT
jgi:hypothetical protein